MRTIWLNLGMAGMWWLMGESYWLVLTPLSVVVLLYSFAHDWHEDAGAYREALAELEAERRLS